MDSNEGLKDQLNSTSCFQTELGYIQCSLSAASSKEKKHLTVRILQIKNNKDLSQKGSDLSIGYLDVNSFTKILHIKNEMGVYIFFDKDNGDQRQKKLPDICDVSLILDVKALDVLFEF